MRSAVRSLFAGLTLGVTPFATPIAAQTPREALRLAPPWTGNAVMYEVNVRQYTPEGTFAALRPHLPRLRQLVNLAAMARLHVENTGLVAAHDTIDFDARNGNGKADLPGEIAA